MTPGQLRGIVCVEGYGAFQGTVRSRLDGVVGKENGAMTYVKESPIAPTTFMSLGRRRCTEVAAVVLRGGITQVKAGQALALACATRSASSARGRRHI